jgi:hypothetical protein
MLLLLVQAAIHMFLINFNQGLIVQLILLQIMNYLVFGGEFILGVVGYPLEAKLEILLEGRTLRFLFVAFEVAGFGELFAQFFNFFAQVVEVFSEVLV